MWDLVLEGLFPEHELELSDPFLQCANLSVGNHHIVYADYLFPSLGRKTRQPKSTVRHEGAILTYTVSLFPHAVYVEESSAREISPFEEII